MTWKHCILACKKEIINHMCFKLLYYRIRVRDVFWLGPQRKVLVSDSKTHLHTPKAVTYHEQYHTLLKVHDRSQPWAYRTQMLLVACCVLRVACCAILIYDLCVIDWPRVPPSPGTRPPPHGSSASSGTHARWPRSCSGSRKSRGRACCHATETCGRAVSVWQRLYISSCMSAG